MNVDSKKLIIFDADGTLRRCTVPGQPCPNRPSEWEVLPGVREKLAVLDRGHVAIVPNQGGVGLGLLSPSMAHSLLSDLASEVFSEGQMKFYRQYICPHAPKAGCRCRKPSPLMLYQAMEVANVTPAETLYVGDMESDREAAQRAGVDFLWAWEFFGWAPVEGQGPGGTLQPEKAVSVTIKWDLGEGNEDAIYLRPKADIAKAIKDASGER